MTRRIPPFVAVAETRMHNQHHHVMKMAKTHGKSVCQRNISRHQLVPGAAAKSVTAAHGIMASMKANQQRINGGRRHLSGDTGICGSISGQHINKSQRWRQRNIVISASASAWPFW